MFVVFLFTSCGVLYTYSLQDLHSWLLYTCFLKPLKQKQTNHTYVRTSSQKAKDPTCHSATCEKRLFVNKQGLAHVRTQQIQFAPVASADLRSCTRQQTRAQQHTKVEKSGYATKRQATRKHNTSGVGPVRSSNNRVTE